MTRVNNSLLAGAALVATLARGVSIGAAMANQPRMHAALGHLQSARGELQAADHDKGGHRGKAIRLVNAAINEVEAGMRFDRRR